MKKLRVLIAEDDGATVERLQGICAEMGCDATVVRTVAAAEKAVCQEEFDVFVWDHYLSDGSTLPFVELAKKKFPRAALIAAAANADIRQMQLANGCSIEARPGEVFNIVRAVISNFPE